MIKAHYNKNRKENICKDLIFDVTSNAKDEKGLEFSLGDKFRILETDQDCILIEKIGDLNNPYFVSIDFLRRISNVAKLDTDK